MSVVRGDRRYLLKGIAPVLLAFIWLGLGWSWWLPTALFLCFLLASPPAVGAVCLLVTLMVLALQSLGLEFSLWEKVPPAQTVLVFAFLVSLARNRHLPHLWDTLFADGRIAAQWARRARNACALVAVGAAFASMFTFASLVECLALAGMYILLWRRLAAFQPRANAGALGGVWRTVALFVLSMTVSLLLLEGGARILFPPKVFLTAAFQPDPNYVFLLRPGGVAEKTVPLPGGQNLRVPLVISEQGLRDRLVPPKRDGEFRIAMLGDSFTMGFTVAEEDSIPRLLEDRLRAAMPEADIRVVNCGLAGAGVLQELGMLRERTLPLEPDLVILQIFPNNDVDNALSVVGKHQRAYSVDWHNTLWDYQFWGYFRVRLEHWASRNLRAYQVFRGATKKSWIRNALGLLRFSSPLLDDDASSENRPVAFEVDLAEWYPELEEGLEIMREHILRMRVECQERGADFMAYCIPGKEEAVDKLWEELTASHPDVRYERLKGIRRVEELLDREGIPRISVLEALRAAEPQEDLYYVLDGHLTKFGNEVVVGGLADSLLSGYLRERASSGAREHVP